jgi:ribosomal protein L29
MKIKGMDGHEYNVTGQGQGNFNTVGAAGGIGWIAEKLTNGNFFNGGGNGNCGCQGGCSDNMLVNRYEMSMQQALAAKDARIALLESNIYNDQKLTEVYKDLNSQIRTIKEQQDAINMQQAVYNGTNTAAISCIQSQIAQLYGLTKLVIPNGSVCPGWGNVTVSPATAPTT